MSGPPGARRGDARAQVLLEAGKELVLTIDEAVDGAGTDSLMFVNYPRLPEKAKRGDQVLLDDGLVTLEVTASDATTV